MADKCFDEALRYFTLLYRFADGADFYLIENKDNEALYQIECAKRATDLFNEHELRKNFEEAQKLIADKDYHEAFHSLERTMDNIARRAFEKVVECQNGGHLR